MIQAWHCSSFLWGRLFVFYDDIYLKSQSSQPGGWDLQKLLQETPDKLYNSVDKRLTGFIDTAVGKTKNVLDKKKHFFIVNALENILKARDLHYVSPIGLQQSVLIYIYSKRSTVITTMFCNWAGAKGSLSSITRVLNNSQHSSARQVPPYSNVVWSFDNVQHLIKMWRLHQLSKPKPLVAIATSVVQTFPDGLGFNDIQYMSENSPLKWLHNFSISNEGKYLVQSYNSEVLLNMLGMHTEEMQIVLGFWEEHVTKELDIVKKEWENREVDSIGMLVKEDATKNSKICINGHANVNVRSNRKYCTVCKAEFLDNGTNDDSIEDLPDDHGYERLKVDDTNSNEPIKVAFSHFGDKSKLYEHVRTIYN